MSARFNFAFVVALFLSMFSLCTEHLFVRLTEPGKSLSTAFQKSTIVSPHGLENKTTASQKSEKTFKKVEYTAIMIEFSDSFLYFDLGVF